MNTLQSNSITQNDIDDVNLQSIHPLVTPAELKTELPLTESAYQTVLHGRETIRNILDGKDKRIFVVIGPCSIHDPVAALLSGYVVTSSVTGRHVITSTTRHTLS